MIKKIVLVFAFVILCISCQENNNNIDINNESVIVNNALFYETSTDNYTITNVTLEGDLLTIKISSSGCDGNSWKAVLIDAYEILESYPVQRNLKLYLENTEACLAVFEKEFTFHISTLKEGFSEVNLNLEGWNTQINY